MGLKKVWFVTGASKGLGLSLVNQLLKAGQSVAATSRNVNDLIAAGNSNSEKFLPLAVNLGDEISVEQAINATIAQFGKIDVVINNAGYGIGGSIEELTDEETRKAELVEYTIDSLVNAFSFQLGDYIASSKLSKLLYLVMKNILDSNEELFEILLRDFF